MPAAHELQGPDHRALLDGAEVLDVLGVVAVAHAAAELLLRRGDEHYIQLVVGHLEALVVFLSGAGDEHPTTALGLDVTELGPLIARALRASNVNAGLGRRPEERLTTYERLSAEDEGVP